MLISKDMKRNEIPSALIIGDSVAMPRKFEKDTINLVETWPYRLAISTPEIYWISNCSGSRSIGDVPDILERTAYYYRPSFIILNVGIVDCAYRALSKYELKAMKLFPYAISSRIRRLIRKNHYFLTKTRRMFYTRPMKFEKILKECIKFCGMINSTLIYIPILTPGERMVKQSYNIIENVKLFNKIVSDNLPGRQIVDIEINENNVDEFVKKEDGHHLNSRGHRLYTERLTQFLEQSGFINPM